MEDFVFDSVVRGHHVYKSIWTPLSGEVLAVEVEDDTEQDNFAIAVHKGTIIVGHVPRELSRTVHFFLRHGGSVTCTKTGHRKYGIGLEVPCFYTMSGKLKYVKRLVKLLSGDASNSTQETG